MRVRASLPDPVAIRCLAVTRHAVHLTRRYGRKIQNHPIGWQGPRGAG